VGDIVEVRFTVVLVLCSSILVAVTIDRFRTWLRSRPAAVPFGPGWVAAALAVVMLIPTAIAVGPNVPLATRAVELPTWYAEVGATLPPGQVLLSYPLPFSGLQSSQAWQALNGMRYAQAGGGGPEGQAGRAGEARPGFEVLFAASFAVGRPPGPTRSNLAAIRRALTIWGVTTIVVPDQEQLPLYERGRSSAYAVALFTAAMGRRPSYRHSAWVWSAVALPGAPIVMSPGAFGHCVAGAPAPRAAPQAAPTCVLASAR
jgi:hypothetical protein